MAGQSDRERLEQMAQANERANTERLAQQQRDGEEAAAQAANSVVHDRQKTDEVLEYCKQQFQGFKLVPTGHEIAVDTCPASRLHDVSRDDGVPFVSLNITHWGAETNDFQGTIPILLVRHRGGRYRIADANGNWTEAESFDALKEKLIAMLSKMDRAYMVNIFSRLRDVRR